MARKLCVVLFFMIVSNPQGRYAHHRSNSFTGSRPEHCFSTNKYCRDISIQRSSLFLKIKHWVRKENFKHSLAPLGCHATNPKECELHVWTQWVASKTFSVNSKVTTGQSNKPHLEKRFETNVTPRLYSLQPHSSQIVIPTDFWISPNMPFHLGILPESPAFPLPWCAVLYGGRGEKGGG